MSQEKTSYPLAWPAGWKRTASHQRKRAKFSTTSTRYTENGSYRQASTVSVAVATQRVLDELKRFGIPDYKVIISTNLKLRRDGLPMSDQKAPADPGAAVYWRDGKHERVMATDVYDKVADNLAALAATIEAMRAIERHGGAVILDRAFTGFTALPEPQAPINWRHVFGMTGISPTADLLKIRYRELRKTQHPDHGGNHDEFIKVEEAYRLACEELGF